MNFDLDLSLPTFSDRIDETFSLNLGESPVDLHLVEIRHLKPVEQGPGVPEGLRTEPFSLLFRGPLDPLLPQQLYTFKHNDLGEFALFITAVGKDEEGMYYESVIN